MGSHEIFFILISFVIGSFPTGFLICKLKEKKDIRESGSRNTGATNVLRICGKGPAIATLGIDIVKGVLPVAYGFVHFNSIFIIALGGAASITGHMFSPFLNLRGGKGVATFTGFLIAFAFRNEGRPALVVFLLSFIVVFYLTRYVSLSSLSGTIGAFFAILFTNSVETSIVIFAVSLIITVKHRNNIGRLLKGNENKLTWRNHG